MLLIHEIIFVFRLSLEQVVLLVHEIIFVFRLSLDQVVLLIHEIILVFFVFGSGGAASP